MESKELTYSEEVLLNHLQLCNEHLCIGHRIEKPQLFKFNIGELVTTLNAHPRNIIGAIHGYIHSPFTNSYRAVLGVNCDVEIDNIRPSDELETLTYNLHTIDFKPVEVRMTVFYRGFAS